MTRLTIFQLCPFSDYLEGQLNDRFDVVRLFEMSDADRQSALARHGDARCGVATGGHIGCPTPLMDALPGLGVVAINGVGFDKVDLEIARARGIRVSTTPGTLTDDVADLAIGLVIGLLRNLPAADAHVRSGAWLAGQMPSGRKVTGRRFGIVGLGHIGSAIADRLRAFGPVHYTGQNRKPVDLPFHESLADLAQAIDVLILASSANAETRHIVNADILKALGPDGYLINIARGSLIDEAALITALADGVIAGAALDVYEEEPQVPEALRKSDRVMLTPHIASATVETRLAMADLVLANLTAFATGTDLPTAIV